MQPQTTTQQSSLPNMRTPSPNKQQQSRSRYMQDYYNKNSRSLRANSLAAYHAKKDAINSKRRHPPPKTTKKTLAKAPRPTPLVHSGLRLQSSPSSGIKSLETPFRPKQLFPHSGPRLDEFGSPFPRSAVKENQLEALTAERTRRSSARADRRKERSLRREEESARKQKRQENRLAAIEAIREGNEAIAEGHETIRRLMEEDSAEAARDREQSAFYEEEFRQEEEEEERDHLAFTNQVLQSAVLEDEIMPLDGDIANYKWEGESILFLFSNVLEGDESLNLAPKDYLNLLVERTSLPLQEGQRRVQRPSDEVILSKFLLPALGQKMLDHSQVAEVMLANEKLLESDASKLNIAELKALIHGKGKKPRPGSRIKADYVSYLEEIMEDPNVWTPVYFSKEEEETFSYLLSLFPEET
mmetsp:Transcript_20454/g.38267  ORF Transcript_20454/g.38267 Transcript_20454/m.38267 type:complete len:414 (+) Transcript_20454:158-1399(+)